MITAPEKASETELSDDIVEMKASYVEALVDAIESEQDLTHPHEQGWVKINPISASVLEAALRDAKAQLEHSKIEHKVNTDSSSLTKLATTLSSSATFGIAVSAFAPMGVALPIIAAAVGAAVGWVVASNADTLKDKHS